MFIGRGEGIADKQRTGSFQGPLAEVPLFLLALLLALLVVRGAPALLYRRVVGGRAAVRTRRTA